MIEPHARKTTTSAARRPASSNEVFEPNFADRLNQGVMAECIVR